MVPRLSLLVLLACWVAACPQPDSLDAGNPERCDNGADDDGDGKVDCLDPDCFGDRACAGGEDCTNHVDDNGDGKVDCADPLCEGKPCSGMCVCRGGQPSFDGGTGGEGADAGGTDAGGSDGGVEVACADGVDNDGDGEVDCADPDCALDPACPRLDDGAACRSDEQCAGGTCLTEASSGNPKGACTSAAPCTPSSGAGCHGGRCAEPIPGTGARCFAPCTGTGLGPTGGCRVGYACTDVDADPSNDNNVCIASCTSDAECAGTTAGFGCNQWSKTCTERDHGLPRFGGSCALPGDCETGVCLTGAGWPGGSCVGLCRADLSNCAPLGTCFHPASWGDNVGYCLETCAGASDCRTDAGYACLDLGAAATVCACGASGSLCLSDAECCSQSCSLYLCD